jgi:GAF domain-containing protein
MAADIVNLRQFRKTKARAEREASAEQNRLTHGRTKAEKTLTRTLNEKALRQLDQGRIEKPGHEQD